MLCVDENADSRIIFEALLGHFVFGIDGHSEGVSAQRELRDVQPLTVDVVVIDVLTAGSNSLIAVIFAVVFGFGAALTVIILQAEAGLVTFGHAIPAGVEDIKVRENLN